MKYYCENTRKGMRLKEVLVAKKFFRTETIIKKTMPVLKPKTDVVDYEQSKAEMLLVKRCLFKILTIISR
jgi:hypothetical protein